MVYIYIILNFDPKHRLWVLIRMAWEKQTCTNNQYFEQEYQKNLLKFTESQTSLIIVWACFHNDTKFSMYHFPLITQTGQLINFQ